MRGGGLDLKRIANIKWRKERHILASMFEQVLSSLYNGHKINFLLRCWHVPGNRFREVGCNQYI